MVIIKKNRAILALVLVSLPSVSLGSPNLKDLGNKPFYVAVTCAGISAAWGFIENYKKNKAKSELEKYKNCENDQFEVAKVLVSLTRIEEQFKGEISVLKNEKEDTVSSQLLKLISARIRSSDFDNYKNCHDYKKHIEQMLQEWSLCSQAIGLKVSKWTGSTTKSNQNHKQLIESSSEIIARIEVIKSLFSQTLTIINNWANALELELMMRHDYQKEYAREIELMQSNRSREEFTKLLDSHVRTNFSQSSEQFPYLAYVDKLTKDNQAINRALGLVEADTPAVFTECRAKAASLENLLSSILQQVVLSDAFVKEKREKPDFDRKNQLLKIELQERQAHIDREKDRLETILQQERNVSQRLINKKAEIDYERQKLEAKQKEIALEMARIRDGKTIDDALKKNNNEWQYQYDRLRADYDAISKKRNELQNKLGNLVSQQQSVAQNSGNIAKADAKLKEMESQTRTLLAQIDALNSKVGEAKSVVNSLVAVSRPPFNPDAMDGLREFCDGIQARIAALQRAIN